MLTRKQYDLLMFTNERVRETGIPPSFDEMADALDLKSKSGIHRLLVGLEERGFIRRMSKRARAIEVIKLPENVSDNARPAISRMQSQRLVSPSHSTIDSRKAVSGALTVPILGRISGGTPIEALQTKVGEIVVPSLMLGAGKYFALEVTGDVMINAAILDGDTIIIQQADTAYTGEIVLALVDETQAALRRLRRRGDCIALEAANPAYETRLYISARIRVMGKLVGVMRRY